MTTISYPRWERKHLTYLPQACQVQKYALRHFQHAFEQLEQVYETRCS